jgi:hypothetical protein
VFRVYGGVEAPVGELWIGEMAYFTLSKEELRRLVEVAKETAPDLSGIRKIRQALEWFATDMSFTGGQIEGGTTHLWQLKWYIALFGDGRPSGGRSNVTEEGVRPFVIMRWRRERLDDIIAEEGEELKPLLGPISKQVGGSREAEGPAVNSWRGLVDAVDWRWVLERVEKLTGELKPWIGPEEMDNTEREGGEEDVGRADAPNTLRRGEEGHGRRQVEGGEGREAGGSGGGVERREDSRRIRR